MRPPAHAAASATSRTRTTAESENVRVFHRGRLGSFMRFPQGIIAHHAGEPRGEDEMSFMDLRQWMQVLEKEGELRRITAEVDWDREIGAIARRVLERKGPALLFENIRGYQHGRCTR